MIPINFSENHNYKLQQKNCVWCGNACSYSGIKHFSFKLPLRNNPQYLTPAETGTIWCSISIIQWIISYLLLNFKF